MAVLVTGGTGFVGKALIMDLLPQSCEVKLRQLLIKAVPSFKPQSGIADILYEA